MIMYDLDDVVLYHKWKEMHGVNNARGKKIPDEYYDVFD